MSDSCVKICGAWEPWLWPEHAQNIKLLIPHPDDEIFACSALMLGAKERNLKIDLIYVTDGDACFGDISSEARQELIATRRRESKSALKVLGLEPSVSYLSLPDSKLKDCREELQKHFRRSFSKKDVVFAPYLEDGHSDHDLIGSLARDAAVDLASCFYFYPVWNWFQTESDRFYKTYSARTLAISSRHLERKARAIQEFHSQIESQDGRPPVLSEDFIAFYSHFPYEVFIP